MSSLYNSIIGRAVLVFRAATRAIGMTLLTLVCASFAQGAMAEIDQSASHMLEAVKRALVDLALTSEVKLGTSAYLDGQGILHESSILSTETKVRGVRILSYLEEAGIAVAKVEGSILANNICPGARPNSMREAQVRVINSLTNEAIGAHYMTELGQFSEQLLRKRLAASNQWSTRPERVYKSSYQRYLSGSSADQVPYRFDISLREQRPMPSARSYVQRARFAGLRAGDDALLWVTEKLPAVLYQKPWPSKNLEYELVLFDRVKGTPLWRKTLPLKYPAVGRGYSKAAMPLKFKQNVAAVTDQFISELNDAIDCQPEAYQLSELPGIKDKASINAGLIAGIEVGDQFLISADANILDEVLSLSGLAGLALAEVESVSRHSATIKHVAGSQWPNTRQIKHSVALHF
jgi:hypothetical protein